MPTYEYRCPDCGEQMDIVQSIHDPTLTVCPSCGSERLRKVFGAVGVMFKGSGFYRTDSRAKEKSTKASASKPAASKASASEAPSTGGPSSGASTPGEGSSAKPAKTPATSASSAPASSSS